MHDHGHHHDHHEVPRRKLSLVILLNLAITIAEVVGGLLSGSLALLSDALHNLSDTMAMAISYLALLISRKPRDERRTFGYRRAQTLAAFVNASFLLLISIYLIYESVMRFLNPEPIKSGLMIIVASIGLAANFLSVLLLHSHAKGNLNLRSSYLHLLGDTISSVGVIMGGIAIHLWGVYWLDPVVTVLIALYILKEVWHVLRKTVDIFMQSAPDIDFDEMQGRIESIDGVGNIHHLHVWMYDEDHTHLEAHVEVDDMLLSETTRIRKQIEEVLHTRYRIRHVTLQMESNPSCPKSLIATTE